MIRKRGAAVESAGPKSLRPGVVQEHIVPGPEAQVGAALESRVGDIEIMRAQVIAGRCVAGAGWRSAGVAAEAADGAPRCRRVDSVIAGTERHRELLRNDVEVGRAERRLLGVAARDVVEERLIVG